MGWRKAHSMPNASSVNQACVKLLQINFIIFELLLHKGTHILLYYYSSNIILHKDLKFKGKTSVVSLPEFYIWIFKLLLQSLCHNHASHLSIMTPQVSVNIGYYVNHYYFQCRCQILIDIILIGSLFLQSTTFQE